VKTIEVKHTLSAAQIFCIGTVVSGNISFFADIRTGSLEMRHQKHGVAR